MIIVYFLVGLIFGSFANAVIWRVHEQEVELAKSKPNKKYLQRLSIRTGRSMCSSCHHELGVVDLIPVVSWLYLRGKCRYCKKPIPDNPLTELATGVLFALSYVIWPITLDSPIVWVQFVCWLAGLVGLVMLAVYDLRWMILPNRMIIPTSYFAGAFALIAIMQSQHVLMSVVQVIASVAIGGGVFYILFQISDGKWIGGGDVKLGWMLGLFAVTPLHAVLFLFLAALLGTVFAIPLLLGHKIGRKATIPFGPFLIAGLIITVLWGQSIINWYLGTLG